MYNRNSFIAAIGRALDIYLKDHGNLKPESIHVHSQRWDDVVREMESSGDEWDGFLWDIPVIQDDTIDTAWNFIGAPVLEHKKCMLCGIVVGRKVHGHSLDEKWVCEHCYDRVMCNRGTMDERWQKIVFENNEKIAKNMSKEYFESYKDLLFGDVADEFEKE